MSEYLEAISRLNAPERTPGVNIPRSLYLPPKNTAKHMNKIMRETLNTPLPKYSIPQTCFINKSDQDFFEFELDKQFTLAKGGRKSIAIRKIEVEAIDNYVNFMSTKRDLYININTGFTLVDTIDISNTLSVTADLKVPFSVNLQSIKDGLISFFTTDTFQERLRQELVDDEITATGKQNGDTVSITFDLPGTLISVDKFSCYVSSDTLDLSRYVTDPVAEVKITPNSDDLVLDLSNLNTVIADTVFVASSLNPWSSKNIIGTIEENFTTLNRIFPYDNSQTFKVWFVDNHGRIFPNTSLVVGFIELELIIDNQNNFVMDD